MKRPHINLKTKLAAALCHMLRANEHGHFVRIISHDEAKRLSEDQIISRFEFHHHPIPKAHDGPDVHWNLPPLPRDEHREITAKIDIPRIAKSKRITRANEDHARRLLAKDRGEAKPRSRWPKRKLQSRGFGVRQQH